ncbi:hypothetical protein BJY01DRAFT_222684 [Aspergillus pseudoustus]|uniref:Uncharacterized protein n=1 Tax=Aspergillus pseudoustus TaxID=1810923 RepID=A0ABR4J7H7_9EURO
MYKDFDLVGVNLERADKVTNDAALDRDGGFASLGRHTQRPWVEERSVVGGEHSLLLGKLLDDLELLHDKSELAKVAVMRALRGPPFQAKHIVLVYSDQINAVVGAVPAAHIAYQGEQDELRTSGPVPANARRVVGKCHHGYLLLCLCECTLRPCSIQSYLPRVQWIPEGRR